MLGNLMDAQITKKHLIFWVREIVNQKSILKFKPPQKNFINIRNCSLLGKHQVVGTHVP
jgi:hypothetical protein